MNNCVCTYHCFFGGLLCLIKQVPGYCPQHPPIPESSPLSFYCFSSLTTDSNLTMASTIITKNIGNCSMPPTTTMPMWVCVTSSSDPCGTRNMDMQCPSEMALDRWGLWEVTESRVGRMGEVDRQRWIVG